MKSETYRVARRRVRRRPAWLLRRRERRIITSRPRPTERELAELVAIRHELMVRAKRRAPSRWWAL